MKKVILVAVVMIFCCSVLFGQSRNDQMKKTPNNANVQKDNEFAQKALQASQAEVNMGQLAQSRGSSQEVRDFGMMMVNDHKKANDELRELTQQRGYSNLSVKVTDMAQKDYDQLTKASGAEFDKAFVNQMVKDHEQAVDLFRKQAENGKDEELKNWAAQTLPTLEKHLEHAKRLQESVKNTK